jgi:CBS domain-containing protein
MDNISDKGTPVMNDQGASGKGLDSRIFMQPVKDLKFSLPVVLDIEESVQDAIMFMQVKQFGCLLVTEKHELVGILTERDIISKAIGEEKGFHDLKVKDIMTPNPETFREDDTIGFAMKAMTAGGYRHVPIVDNENIPVGIVSVRDIVSFIVDHFAAEVLNLPPRPRR